MDWIAVTVSTTTAGSELVSEQLIEAGSAGTMIVDRNDFVKNQRPEGQWDILDESILDNMPEDVRVTGYYPKDARIMDILNDIRARMDALTRRAPETDWGTLAVTDDTLDDEDWAENWKKQYVPFRIGTHTVIKPGWCAYDAQPGDRVIEIDPGMAFGTGTHETTALCAGLIEEYVFPGADVIDVGTGTGILAMVSRLAGAKHVLATDIDPMACRVARENVRINHMEDFICVREGDLLAAVEETGDIVIANIIADIVCVLAEPVRKHIRENGVFLCSGIAREKQEKVLEALKSAGYRALDIREKGEWVAIACRR